MHVWERSNWGDEIVYAILIIINAWREYRYILLYTFAFTLLFILFLNFYSLFWLIYVPKLLFGSNNTCNISRVYFHKRLDNQRLCFPIQMKISSFHYWLMIRCMIIYHQYQMLALFAAGLFVKLIVSGYYRVRFTMGFLYTTGIDSICTESDIHILHIKLNKVVIYFMLIHILYTTLNSQSTYFVSIQNPNSYSDLNQKCVL